jgi:geranylgeranylglycerol-phosphate geranylgeranyltransferase
MLKSASPKPTDWRTQIIALSQLFRVSVSGAAALAGSSACYTLNSTLPFADYFLIALVLACMTAAACAINDYWDVEKDRINHPERPLPSGRLTLEQAWYAAILSFACALVAAIPLGQSVVGLVGLSTLLLWNYSHLLKLNGILGNLIVAMVIALLILLGSIVAGRPWAMLYPMGFLFLYALAREFIWDVHDAEGDRRQGIITIANHWGASMAFRLTWGLLGVLVSSIPVALLLPLSHAGWFVTFTLLMLLCFGIPLRLYQQQQSDIHYQHLVWWERLGLLFGILGLFGTTTPTL